MTYEKSREKKEEKIASNNKTCCLRQFTVILLQIVMVSPGTHLVNKL